MESQHAIQGPQQAGDYAGRDVDCLAALRPSVADLAISSGETLSAAVRGEISGDFAALVRRAEAAGWKGHEAEAAIRRLARELEGAEGIIFD